jgi:hypothetical protein
VEGQDTQDGRRQTGSVHAVIQSGIVVNEISNKYGTGGILCDQKLASDSSGLSGGFSGQRAWVRIFKKWAPGSYCLELVVACPAAGTSAQFLLVGGSLKANPF